MAPRSPWLVLWIFLPLVAGVLAIALVDSDTGPFEQWRVGLIFGTIYAQTTFMAFWSALGPPRSWWRVLGSFLWCGVLSAGLLGNSILHQHGDLESFAIIAACTFSQWLLIQLPLWPLALSYGMEVRHQDFASRPVTRQDWQFGIRQLMVITAAVGVLLAIGRQIVTSGVLSGVFVGSFREVPIFLFLSTAAVLMTFPLVLAALLPSKMAVPSVASILVLIAILTMWELPLLQKFHSGPGPDKYHLIFVNGFSVAWLLLLMIIVRISGYSLRKK